jgi:hypothetical protein
MNYRKLALALTVASAATSAHPAFASSFAIEGDASSLTLVAEDASRSAIVAAIVERFELQEEGGGVEEGVINGRYSGTLGQVLKSILPDEGYAISYRDGRPARLTFAGRNGSGSTPRPEVAAGVPAQPEPRAATPATQPDDTPEARIANMLERRTFEQVLGTKPSAPPPPSAGSGKSMQQEIAEATARAVRELEALTRGLRGSNQNQ